MSFCWHFWCHFAVMLVANVDWSPFFSKVGDQLRGTSNPEGSHPFFQRDVDVAEPCQLPGGWTSNYPIWKSCTTRLECENLKDIVKTHGVSMGLVYLPTFYHNKSTRQIYHTWIVWEMPCWKSQLTSFEHFSISGDCHMPPRQPQCQDPILKPRD